MYLLSVAKFDITPAVNTAQTSVQGARSAAGVGPIGPLQGTVTD